MSDISVARLQQLLAEFDARERRALLGGVLATNVVLSNSEAADGLVGDVVVVGQGGAVPPSAPTVKKATASPLANAGRVLGILIDPVLRGSSGLCAMLGVLPPSVTGLSSGSAGLVRVNPANARCERVGGFSPGDFPIGSVDSDGNLTMSGAGAGDGGGGGGGGGGGDFFGPSSAPDGTPVLFDGTSGKLGKAGPINLAGGGTFVTGTLPTSSQDPQAMGGDCSGTTANCTVGKINGTTHSAGGSLATGAVLRATGVSSAAYGAIDLANSSAVTGILPTANQAAQPAQTMGGDCSGSTSLCTVAKINGVTIPAGGALTTGQALRATGASAAAYGPIDLANASAVTGVLPTANMDPTLGMQPVAPPAPLTFALTNGGNTDVTAYTVPASPAGINRFSALFIVVRLDVAITGSGSVVVRAGTTTGGNDLLSDSSAWSSATPVGTEIGMSIADCGTGMPLSTGFIAELAAAATIKARSTTSGATITGGSAKVYVYGFAKN